jgi:virulence-associated protein VagC
MSEAADAVEAVYEGARLVIDPLDKMEERADASTVKQAKEHAMSVLKAALDQ